MDRFARGSQLLAPSAPLRFRHCRQWILPFVPRGLHYSDPPSLSATRVTPSRFDVIYKGLLQLRHRGRVTRVPRFSPGDISALPDNLLLTRESFRFARGG